MSAAPIRSIFIHSCGWWSSSHAKTCTRRLSGRLKIALYWIDYRRQPSFIVHVITDFLPPMPRVHSWYSAAQTQVSTYRKEHECSTHRQPARYSQQLTALAPKECHNALCMVMKEVYNQYTPDTTAQNPQRVLLLRAAQRRDMIANQCTNTNTRVRLVKDTRGQGRGGML